MLRLVPEPAASSAANLQLLLEESLRHFGTLDSCTPVRVSLQGELPGLEQLRVDCSGAESRFDSRLPSPAEPLQAQASFTVHDVELRAEPLRWSIFAGEPVAGAVRLTAEDTRFAVVRDAAGDSWLLVRAARRVGVEAQLSRSELDRAVLQLVQRTAQTHGLAIDSAEVTLAAEPERKLRFAATCAVRKAFARGTVRITGATEIDPSLRLRVVDLSSSGEGLLGRMVASVLEPVLGRCRGVVVDLGRYLLPGLRCARVDVRIDPDGGVLLEAEGSLSP